MPELPNGVPETESPDSKKKRKIAEDFLNEPKAPLEETWEPLEPHEVVTIAKPIRKGRRKKPPVGKFSLCLVYLLLSKVHFTDLLKESNTLKKCMK